RVAPDAHVPLDVPPDAPARQEFRGEERPKHGAADSQRIGGRHRGGGRGVQARAGGHRGKTAAERRPLAQVTIRGQSRAAAHTRTTRLTSSTLTSAPRPKAEVMPGIMRVRSASTW